MPNRNNVTLDTFGLNRILRNLPGNQKQLIKRLAFEVEARAKLKAPVDTGALRASIYTHVDGEAADPPSIDGDAPRVALPDPPANTAHVGPSVDYGLYVELGTSDMVAQPYLTPAVREVEANLRSYMDDFQRVVTDE